MAQALCPSCNAVLAERENGSYFCTPEGKVFGANEVTFADAAPGASAASVLVVTSETVPGYATGELRGEVFGVSSRARNMFSDLGAGVKSLVGGQIRGYQSLVQTAMAEAAAQLRQEARQRGANAVVAARWQTTEIGDTIQVIAYGTAVTLEDPEADRASGGGRSAKDLPASP